MRQFLDGAIQARAETRLDGRDSVDCADVRAGIMGGAETLQYVSRRYDGGADARLRADDFPARNVDGDAVPARRDAYQSGVAAADSLGLGD